MHDQDPHFSDELLLKLLDGELSRPEADSLEAHLGECWTCRARRQQLDRTIASFIQAYQQDTEDSLPPANGPRALLKAQLTLNSRRPPDHFPQWISLRPKSLSFAALSLVCLLITGWYVARIGHSDGRGGLVVSTPNTSLTPGVAILLSRNAVCSQANVKNKDVPASIRRMVLEEYGLGKAQPRSYEVDYLVTPALGGSDDIRNLWPHSYSSVWNAMVKDALEDRLRDMVCAGEIDLPAAQREIAENWIEAYKKYFHTDHPLPEHTRR